MKALVTIQEKSWVTDLSNGIDISIPLREDQQVNCFYAPPFSRAPVISSDFIGSTAKGGLLNFFNLHLNPHGNGTHTESVQHLDHRGPSVNNVLTKQHFLGFLLTVTPEINNQGKSIRKSAIMDFPSGMEALIIRTLPNSQDKLKKNYSGSNPCFIDKEAMDYIVQRGIQHLIVDIPSVDPEEDEGALLSHKSFWNYPFSLDSRKTITELVFIPDSLKDGYYLVNLNPAPIVNDASPSRPVLYKLKPYNE